MRKFQSSLYEGSEPDILETIFKLSGKIAYDSCFFYRSEKFFFLTDFPPHLERHYHCSKIRSNPLNTPPSQDLI